MSAVGGILQARAAASAAAARSARPWLVAVAATGMSAGLAGANGGYFPTSFGWTALALSFASLVALVRGAEWPSAAAWSFMAGLGALLVWVTASALWSPSLSRTVVEIERTSVYVAGAACLLLLLRRQDIPRLLGGVVAGTTIVAAYGLATRLFPERLGEFDPVAGYRLAEPLGYWNALGILSGLGLLLAIGLAARAGSVRARAAAAAAVPLLLATVYFTFGRATWIALAFGLATMLAADRRRLQLAGAALVALVPAAIAVALAVGSPALTRSDTALAAAAEEGRDLAVALVALAVAAGLLTVVAVRLEQRLELGRTVRRALAALLVSVVAGGLTFGLIRVGGPAGLVERAHGSFSHVTPDGGVDLNERLFTLSANGRAQYWTAAWRAVQDRPVLGLGAGGFERHWLATRDDPFKVRDAHSLYLETLAELGPLGLALLLVALGVPVTAALRRREAALTAPVLGAYAAYLVHAGVDWDWEMTSVTLVALACGAALLVLTSREEESRSLPRAATLAGSVAAVAVAAFALVFALGATALSESQNAALDGRFADATAHAHRAASLAPWSVEPLRALADAQLASGDDATAALTLERALERDPGDWSLWLERARATEGAARAAALAEATRLNPLSPELAVLRAELADETAFVVVAEDAP